jgi:hypothetical protein
MSDYWLSKAAAAESLLDQLRVEFEETVRNYQQRIEDLERIVLEANLQAQTTGVKNEHIQ